MSPRDPQHDQRQFGGAGFVIFGLAVAAIPFFGFLSVATARLGPASIPIWAIAIAGAAVIFRGPIGQAIGRSIGGPSEQGEVEVPPELYAELDELRARVGELEERVDFSERLLTKSQEEKRSE